MSLSSLELEKFEATDRKMEEERRQTEWPLLHGDGLPVASACTTEPARGLYLHLRKE